MSVLEDKLTAIMTACEHLKTTSAELNYLMGEEDAEEQIWSAIEKLKAAQEAMHSTFRDYVLTMHVLIRERRNGNNPI